MAMEFPLSDFCIIKLSFFDSDFHDPNSSLVKFKAAQKMRNILSNSSKFSEVFVTNEKHLNFLVNIEKQITDLLNS